MILSSKQLEELETLTSGALEFDEESGEEAEVVDEGTESALAWRRGMIERALNNVKRAHKKATDAEAPSLKVGTLVYDEQTKHFGRITKVEGKTAQVSLIAGGESVIGAQKQTSAPAPVSKPVLKTPVSAPKKAPAPAAQSKKPVPRPVTTKPAPKSKRSDVRRPKPAVKVDPKKDKRFAAPQRGTDANSYIRQNFMSMSNKELAKVTGLSEHTIRRKLGEWGMRRA